MVLDAILNFFRSLIGGIFGLLPEWTIEVNTEQATALRMHIAWFDGWLPVTETFQCAGFLATAFIAVIGFKFILKVVDWIRG